jgi:hypothetical protein
MSWEGEPTTEQDGLQEQNEKMRQALEHVRSTLKLQHAMHPEHGWDAYVQRIVEPALKQ